MKNCQICDEEINLTNASKYCRECAVLVDKRVRKKAYENYKKKQAKERRLSENKKPIEEPKSRLDRKSYWNNRDTSCDGSQYF